MLQFASNKSPCQLLHNLPIEYNHIPFGKVFLTFSDFLEIKIIRVRYNNSVHDRLVILFTTKFRIVAIIALRIEYKLYLKVCQVYLLFAHFFIQYIPQRHHKQYNELTVLLRILTVKYKQPLTVFILKLFDLLEDLYIV